MTHLRAPHQIVVTIFSLYSDIQKILTLFEKALKSFSAQSLVVIRPCVTYSVGKNRDLWYCHKFTKIVKVVNEEWIFIETESKFSFTSKILSISQSYLRPKFYRYHKILSISQSYLFTSLSFRASSNNRGPEICAGSCFIVEICQIFHCAS